MHHVTHKPNIDSAWPKILMGCPPVNGLSPSYVNCEVRSETYGTTFCVCPTADYSLDSMGCIYTIDLQGAGLPTYQDDKYILKWEITYPDNDNTQRTEFTSFAIDTVDAPPDIDELKAEFRSMAEEVLGEGVKWVTAADHAVDKPKFTPDAEMLRDEIRSAVKDSLRTRDPYDPVGVPREGGNLIFKTDAGGKAVFNSDVEFNGDVKLPALDRMVDAINLTNERITTLAEQFSKYVDQSTKALEIDAAAIASAVWGLEAPLVSPPPATEIPSPDPAQLDERHTLRSFTDVWVDDHGIWRPVMALNGRQVPPGSSRYYRPTGPFNVHQHDHEAERRAYLADAKAA